MRPGAAAPGGSYRGSGAKPTAWRDIWSAGQGVGSIVDVPSVGELVGRLKEEYRAAAAEIAELTRNYL